MGDNSSRGRGFYRGRGWNQYRRKRGNSDNQTTASKDSAHTKSSEVSKKSSRSSGQQPITINISRHTGPYKGWELYYPQEEFKDGSDTHIRVKAAEAYINRHKSTFNIKNGENSVQLDLLHLLSDEEFTLAWSSFNVDLSNNPRNTLDCLGLAVHQAFDIEKKILVRPMNHQPVIPLTNLKVNYFGKLVSIRGTVIRVGSPGLICKSMAFECTSCHGTQALVQPQGIYTVPGSCISCQELGKLQPLQSSPFTITEDIQIAKIQETNIQSGSGSIPKSVEVEFHGDLIGTASPGDLLSVTGIVQVRPETRGGEDGKKGARLMQLYIEAIAVHNQRTLNHPTLTFTLKDYYAIQEIHSSDNIFRLLVQSLCPSIFGHEIVKAGLILGLMGGTESEGGSRSNPHILLIGDPGLGKSQLLQATTTAAPRAVYVCGNACTASGLTVSLSRGEGGGFTLEAGALVLSDRGICCVDELDKLNLTGHGALLEAMEQGTVSVARGGVVCRLAAAPTVLAAANPAQGHYDRSKTVLENLKMNSALLSRFDLVFILLDRPNEHMDALLSDHVLALHSGVQPKNLNISAMSSASTSQNGETLLERLRINPEENFDPLPTVLLRKYIAYSRKYVHPKLSEEATFVLRDFYLSLRESNKSKIGGTPVTTRQLEACVRLTQARAKVSLREEATVEDAKDVVEIMKHSLVDTLTDEYGSIQMNRSVHGSGMSSRNHVKKFINLLTQHATKVGKDVFTRTEMTQLHKSYSLSGDPTTLIESLHVHGYLLLKGPNLYKILTI